MPPSEEETPAAVRVLGVWASPFVIRVRMALKLKGVEYEFVEETMGKKSELLLRSNPVHKKIPVLLHRGKPVSESLVIVQYIDEAWPSDGPALLPSDPHARAAARFCAQYVEDKVPPAIRVLRGTVAGDRDEAAAQLSAALQHLEEALVGCGQGKEYFGGDSIGYVDIALASHLGWIKALEKIAGVAPFLDAAKLPNLAAWADRIRAHPAVVHALPHADRFVEYCAKYGSFGTSIRASKVLQGNNAP